MRRECGFTFILKQVLRHPTPPLMPASKAHQAFSFHGLARVLAEKALLCTSQTVPHRPPPYALLTQHNTDRRESLEITDNSKDNTNKHDA